MGKLALLVCDRRVYLGGDAAAISFHTIFIDFGRAEV